MRNMETLPDGMQPYSNRLAEKDGSDLVAKAIISGIAKIGIGVPEQVKQAALGFNIKNGGELQVKLAEATELAAKLLINDELSNLLGDIQPSRNAGQLGDNIKQQVSKSVSQASLPALAQMQQYNEPETTAGSPDQATSEAIERLGGEGGGDEPEPEAPETAEGSPTEPTAGEEGQQAPPGSAVNIPDEAKESAVTDQGMINLSDEDAEKHKQRLAEFAQAEQEKQLGGDDESDMQDEEANEKMKEAEMAANLQREQQQDRQRKSRSMQIQESQRKMQEAEQASAADAGGGEAAIEGEARSKAAGGKLTERGVAKAGERIGQSIKARMKNGEFKGFAIAMVVAIAKDAIDWMEPSGMLPALVSVFLGGILTAILLGEGTYFKRLLIKRFLGKAIIGCIAEFIPGFNLFPTYTIGILLMKADADAEVKKQKKHYNIVAEEEAKLKNRLLRRPQGS